MLIASSPLTVPSTNPVSPTAVLLVNCAMCVAVPLTVPPPQPVQDVTVMFPDVSDVTPLSTTVCEPDATGIVPEVSVPVMPVALPVAVSVSVFAPYVQLIPVEQTILAVPLNSEPSSDEPL